MLQKLRDKTSGWIATAILGLLMIPFLFVIDNRYLGGVGADNVAKVQAPPSWWKSAPSWWPASLLWSDADISTQEFRTRFQQERAQEQAQQRDSFDAEAFEKTDNKLKLLDQMVDEKVLQLLAERSGIVVGDAAIRDYIAGIQAFQVDGKFDANQYRLRLAQGNPPRTPQQFETLVRDSLQQALIPSAIADSAFLPKKSFENLFKLMGETRDIQLVTLPDPEKDTAPVSDDEIKHWYDAHQADYRDPEKVTIEYVELSPSDLPAAKPADEETLRKRYEDEKSRFVEPEQRLASHILIAAGKDPASQKAAEEKAAKLAAEAKKPGADFAALARANSEDPGSKDSGGDLGWVDRGTMVKPFEDALFGMKKGDVVGPIKTQFGYHIIKLRDVKGGEGKSFEQVKDQLAAEQLKADHDKAYSDLSGRLVDLVYKNPTELAPAAKELGLKVRTLGPFSRDNATGIAANDAVKRVAFSDAAIRDGTASDPIDLGNDHSVMLRVTGHTPEHALPLDQVHDRVVAAIHADRELKANEKAADALLARLNKGEKLDDIAAKDELKVVPIPGLPRGAPLPSAEGNNAIFAAPAPVGEKPSYGRVALPNGQVAVFAVTKVTPGDLSKLPAAQRDALRSQLAQIQGSTVARDYIAKLRKQFKVTIDESKL